MYDYTPISKANEKEIPTYQEFVRGTTPKFAYTLTDSSGDALDLTQFSTIKITIAQVGERYSGRRLTLEDNDISANGNVISFALTEAQSLLFRSGYVSLQIYGKSEESGSWATLAEDVTVKIRKSLKDGDSVDEPSPGTSSTFSVGETTVTGTLSVDHVSYANGTKDYEELKHKPVLAYGDQQKELVGTIRMTDFGLREEAVQPLTNTDIDNLIRGLF